MLTSKKFVIFGPFETLKRMAPALQAELAPKYAFKYLSLAERDEVHVFVFEEYQRQHNSSTSLSVVVELSNRSLKVEMFPTGGRMGFRGSSSATDRPAFESVLDFLGDFSSRYGLTKQEIIPPTEDKKDA